MRNRTQWVTRIVRLSDPEIKTESEALTAEEGLGMMWQLALDAWAFMKETHAESGLQRHVVRLIRGKN